MNAKKKKPLKSNINYKVIAIASVIFNAVLLGMIGTSTIAVQNGSLDYMIVSNGTELMCSDDFRERVRQDAVNQGAGSQETAARLATLDFPCTRGGAATYYADGYDAYAKSIGLTDAE